MGTKDLSIMYILLSYAKYTEMIFLNGKLVLWVRNARVSRICVFVDVVRQEWSFLRVFTAYKK